jgi:WD40 repeat protein
MKKWMNALILLMVVCGLSISCSKGSDYMAATPTTAIENRPTAIFLPTTARPMVVNPAGPKYDLSCWPIKPLQETKDIKGSLVYTIDNPQTPGPNKTVSILALDVDSMKIKKINNFGPPELSSTDFTKIAAQLNTKIFVITPSKVQTYLVPSYSFKIGAYLTDGRIRLNSLMNDTNYDKNGKGLDLRYYILDTTTGEVQKNAVFLPNYYEDDNRTLEYNPDMKYVLYRSLAYGTEADFTLFDLENNKVVWVGPPRDNNLVYLADSHLTWRPKENWAYLAPDWMSNTDMLTALFLDKSTGQIKYYSISTNGDISPIADFDMTDIINGTWSQAGGAEIVNHPVWSPNGRYLLTMGKAKDKDRGNFMYLWDSQENIIYKPCLPNETETVLQPEIMQYSNASSFIVKLTFMAFVDPEDNQFQAQVFKSYFLDPAQKIISEVPDLNQVGNPLITNNDEINSLFGWVNWEIP